MNGQSTDSVTEQRCPCGSEIPYANCCAPLHRREVKASTPEALMRSRYSAFALGGLGAYLLDTWDRDSRPAELTAEALDARDSDWLGLEILDSGFSGARGSVEFKARCVPRDASVTQPQTLHERSRFRRRGGAWVYVDGVLDPAPETPRASSVSRNAPCPCGSGKKAKRCCHA